jgi:hypothetical protein
MMDSDRRCPTPSATCSVEECRHMQVVLSIEQAWLTGRSRSTSRLHDLFCLLQKKN